MIHHWQADVEMEVWCLFELTEKPDLWDVAGLERDDFTTKDHQQWFSVLEAQQRIGKPYQNMDALQDFLNNDPKGNQELARYMILKLADSWHWFMGPRMLADRANQLRTFRYRRELAKAGQRITERANVPEEGEGALEDEMDFLARLKDRIGVELGVQDHLSVFEQNMDAARQPMYWPRQDARMKGGVPARGGVLTIMARPSVGKTAYSLQTARNVAQNNPNDFVAFCSLEMAHHECVERLLCSHCRVEDSRLKLGLQEPGKVQWPGEDPLSFQQQYRNLLIWDDLFTLEDIKRRASRVGGRIRLLVIDYVQLLDVPGRDEYQQITWVYRNSKRFAKALDTTVILCCQITREGRRDKCPKLESGRGSGAIEEGSDIVVGLWRPNWDKEQKDETPDCDLRATILKNRYGWCGTAPMRFYVPHQHLDEVPYGDAYERENFTANESLF
jgi:replicative DNA helicase